MKKSFLVTMIFLMPFFSGINVDAESTPDDMVFVPGGIVKIGITKKQLRYVVNTIGGGKRYHKSARPVHKVKIKPFYIDIYEVTNKKYAEFLNSVKKHKGEQLWIDLEGVADETDEKSRIHLKGDKYTVTDGYDEHPVIFVSWYGAKAYAKWAGKRLPTEFEWERAARGEERYIYPWGNRYKKKYANCADGGPYKIVDVGKFNRKNVSPYGCYDMAGNVLEWTSSEYLPYPKSRYKDEFYSGGDYGKRYVARGGSWFVKDDECVTTKRYRYRPNSCFEDMGFRCVKDAQTTSDDIAAAVSESVIEPEHAKAVQAAPKKSTAVPAVSVSVKEDVTEAVKTVRGEYYGMVLIPAGIVRIGIKKKDLKYVVRKLHGVKKYHKSARPRHKVDINAFYIDVNEVSNKQYAEFLNAVKKDKGSNGQWINFNGTADEGDEKCRITKVNEKYTIAEGYSNYPVIFVSWYGANAYSEWAGKRLPTEFEWEKAARGEENSLFPWGNNFEKYANCADGGPDKTVEVGKYSRYNVSAYGCNDMAGNVLEWTASEYLPYPKSRFRDEFYSGGDYGVRYVARGGSWFVNGDECVTTKRFRYDPKGMFEDVGFRCAKDTK